MPQTKIALLCRLSCILLLINTVFLFGQEKAKLSGWIRTGLAKVYEERTSESFYAAKLQYEIKLGKGLEAQVDLRGASTRHEIELREAYFTADLGTGLNLDFGQHKKRFGLEYQKSKENLRTLERTLVYRYLETFGFAGRELNLRYYRTSKEDKRRSGYSFSLGYNEAHDLNLIARWQRLRTLG
ncbi:MAG: porin, partial [candidate division KSB1 bacterium]